MPAVVPQLSSKAPGPAAQRLSLRDGLWNHGGCPVLPAPSSRPLPPSPSTTTPFLPPHLSSCSKHVLTTEWMAGLPIDKAAAEGAIEPAERDRIGERLLWLTLSELFKFRFMQTDPNWSNFLYEPRTRQLSMIDFGACREYDAPFAASYLRLVRACADGELCPPRQLPRQRRRPRGRARLLTPAARCDSGEAQREAILHHSRELGFLTGEEGRTMLDAHTRAAVLVGRCTPLSPSISPYLLVSPCISLHLPVSARICPYLVSPGISVYLPVYSGISRYLPVFPGISRYLPLALPQLPKEHRRPLGAGARPCRPFADGEQPYDFGKQTISKRVTGDVQTMLRERLTPPRKVTPHAPRLSDDTRPPTHRARPVRAGDLLASPEAQRLLPCL